MVSYPEIDRIKVPHGFRQAAGVFAVLCCLVAAPDFVRAEIAVETSPGTGAVQLLHIFGRSGPEPWPDSYRPDVCRQDGPDPWPDVCRKDGPTPWPELGIQDGPDPWPDLRKVDGPDPWPDFGVVRMIPFHRAANPSGDENGDQDPDIATSAQGRPTVVYSTRENGNFEIALMEWEGTSWGARVLLTDNTVDDRLPKVCIDGEGQPVLAWWRDGGTPSIWMSRRRASGTWDNESQVSSLDEEASHPSLAVLPDGSTLIAYESSGPERAIVIAKAEPGFPGITPVFVREAVATTDYERELMPEVALRGATVWVSWIHNDTQIGWSRLLDGSWTSPEFESLNGVGDIQAARFRIKNRLPVR